MAPSQLANDHPDEGIEEDKGMSWSRKKGRLFCATQNNKKIPKVCIFSHVRQRCVFSSRVRSQQQHLCSLHQMNRLKTSTKQFPLGES